MRFSVVLLLMFCLMPGVSAASSVWAVSLRSVGFGWRGWRRGRVGCFGCGRVVGTVGRSWWRIVCRARRRAGWLRRGRRHRWMWRRVRRGGRRCDRGEYSGGLWRGRRRVRIRGLRCGGGVASRAGCAAFDAGEVRVAPAAACSADVRAAASVGGFPGSGARVGAGAGRPVGTFDGVLDHGVVLGDLVGGAPRGVDAGQPGRSAAGGCDCAQ